MLLTAIVFFIILSLLVFVHELGHYTVARIIGVHVEEFGFGLPPRIWGKKIGKTIYSVNWLPIGGFVRLAGEDEAELIHRKSKIKNPQSYFWARTKKERVAILLAGVFMNLILAYGITTFLLTQGVYETSGRVHIEAIFPGSPAEEGGLMEGDVLLAIASSEDPQNPHTLAVPSDLITFTHAHAGQNVVLTVTRDSRALSIHLVPRTVVPKGEGPMGVAISDLELKTYSWTEAPFVAVRIIAERAYQMVVGIVSVIWKALQLQSPGMDVAGPIGIAQVTGQAVRFGFKAVLEFMSILSLNLAILNVLPIPALDGGRVVFVFIEKVVGRRVRPAFEQSAHQVGMIILLFLVLLISINDILRLARGG
jgi:regulator of sigma E protease